MFKIRMKHEYLGFECIEVDNVHIISRKDNPDLFPTYFGYVDDTIERWGYKDSDCVAVLTYFEKGEEQFTALFKDTELRVDGSLV